MKDLDVTSRRWTIGHLLTTFGLFGSLLVYIVAFAQDQTRTETKQEIIIEQQKVIKQDIKDASKRQQQIREILIRIETKLEKKP